MVTAARLDLNVDGDAVPQLAVGLAQQNWTAGQMSVPVFNSSLMLLTQHSIDGDYSVYSTTDAYLVPVAFAWINQGKAVVEKPIPNHGFIAYSVPNTANGYLKVTDATLTVSYGEFAVVASPAFGECVPLAGGCGPGTRSRNVTCHWMPSAGDSNRVDGRFCSGVRAPSDSLPCVSTRGCAKNWTCPCHPTHCGPRDCAKDMPQGNACYCVAALPNGSHIPVADAECAGWPLRAWAGRRCSPAFAARRAVRAPLAWPPRIAAAQVRARSTACRRAWRPARLAARTLHGRRRPGVAASPCLAVHAARARRRAA
jgi:hypothetical protein